MGNFYGSASVETDSVETDMDQRWKFSLWILGSFLLPIAIAALGYGLAKPLRADLATTQNAISDSTGLSCQTIIADPNPPLNVRSSPVVASDNMLGRLPNGTTLSIVDENEGWLRINSPIQGWVYKELTVTSCVGLTETASTMPTPIASAVTDQGTQLMAIATEQYHSGNLNGAIALAQTIPADSAARPVAQWAIVHWQRDWSRAEANYYSAHKALRDGRWQDALSYVDDYPDIRYWKEKMAIVAQGAIRKQR